MWKDLGRLWPSTCLLCLEPGEQICATCYKIFFEVVVEPMVLDTVVVQAGFRYNKALRYLLALTKHQGYYRIGITLGRLLAKRFMSLPQTVDLGLWQCSTWVPVPISTDRYAERGFNQVDYIYRGFSQEVLQILPLTFNYRDIMHRTVATQTQIGQNSGSRKENLAGVFALKQGVSPPRSVLLLDDVCTTGSTLAECATTLRQAGVEKVEAISLFAA